MAENNKKTILLVEDEFLIVMAEKRQLESYGYAVAIANSGEKAIASCRENDNIDLVLMDINLGTGIDGTEAAKTILAMRDLPLVFLSSHQEKEVVETTEGITSYGYVVKNSGETVLVAAIKMAFRLFEAKVEEKRKSFALRDSEAKYRRLIEYLPDMIYIFSDCRGGIFYSPSVAKTLGYPLEYLYDHPFLWNERIHQDDRPTVARAIGAAKGGEPFVLEYRILDATDSWHWLLDRSIEQHANDGEILIEGLATDITDRKREEEILRKKIGELERVHKLTVDRELAMVALKKEINGLRRRLGEKEKYASRTEPNEV